MVTRSKEMYIVAFYFAKFGQVVDNKTFPPKELGTKSWAEAYWMFYKKFGNGRSVRSFENTLKNARDEYDSHMPNTLRIGWLNTDGKPKKLVKNASEVLEIFNSKSQDELWEEIKKYASLDVKDYIQEFEDLASVQDSEVEYLGSRSNSTTEGGKKISFHLFMKEILN